MNNQKEILILNTGGTFNKFYEPISGSLIVEKENKFIEELIVKSFKSISLVNVYGLIYKDSLDITKEDRVQLVNKIETSKEDKIIIIHGTDTMDKTAKYLNKHIKNKQIVLVGSMLPFSIEPIEATANLMCAYGFLKSNKKNNIYISMHGYIDKYNKIAKNRTKGIFECH